MNRAGSIVTVAAATALVAGAGIAAVAVIHSATGTPQTETLSVVASDAGGSAVALPDPNTGSLPAVTLDATQAQLPGVQPIVTVQAPTEPKSATATSPDAKSTQKNVKPQVQTSATPMSEQARALTSDQAISIVKGNVDGALRDVSTKQTSHGGYDAWAVTFAKADGSVLTGYVYLYDDQGTVYDWKVVREPDPVVVKVPAQTTSSAPQRGDDRHESEHGDSEHGDSDDHDSNHHESEHDDD